MDVDILRDALACLVMSGMHCCAYSPQARGVGGAHTGFVPNACNSRKAARALNCHQCNERRIAELNSEQDFPQFRWQGSAQKWEELSQQARKSLELPPAEQNRLM